MADPIPKKTILLISAKTYLQITGQAGFVPQNYTMRETKTSSKAISILEQQKIDVVLYDIETVQEQEMDLVHYIKTRSAHTEIVVLTSIATIDAATKALRNGAAFYLIKPVQHSDVKTAIDKLSAKVDNLSDYRELEQRFLTDLMAGSVAMQKMLKLAMKIAPTSSTVLIGGESGTGKEFFARIIHHMSQRTDGKFVAMNCGAVPDTLFESELFGHTKGSFTGADRDRVGLVEEAHLGTLFLDEIGELTPAAQVKLLRFLQERTFKRIGDNIQRSVNVRIIAATNKDLPTLIAEKKFREDLYYRLNVFTLNLPPLRERKETIPNLIKLFVHKNNEKMDKHISAISPGAEALLAGYDYPGNVRELENILEHAMVLADTNEITEKDLPEFMTPMRLLLTAPQTQALCAPQSVNDIVTLAEYEKQYIKKALVVCKNNYSEAAKKLGVSRSTLWRKIKEYSLASNNTIEN